MYKNIKVGFENRDLMLDKRKKEILRTWYLKNNNQQIVT